MNYRILSAAFNTITANGIKLWAINLLGKKYGLADADGKIVRVVGWGGKEYFAKVRTVRC